MIADASHETEASGGDTVGRLFKYRDADGRWCAVWVEASTFLALESMERGYRRREQRWHQTHRTFTDLKIRNETPDASPPVGPPSPGGNPWEGPRYSFALLLGESRTWRGSPRHGRHCDICKGDWLGVEVYCLGCDRSGKDLIIGRPTAEDLKKRKVRMQYSPGKLKGGLK